MRHQSSFSAAGQISTAKFLGLAPSHCNPMLTMKFNESALDCARLWYLATHLHHLSSFIIIYHHLSSFIIICCHVCCVLTRLAQEAATAVAAVAPERFQRCLRGLFPLPKRFELEQLEDDSDPWLRMLQSVDAVVKKGFRQHNDQLRRLHSRDCWTCPSQCLQRFYFWCSFFFFLSIVSLHVGDRRIVSQISLGLIFPAS